jgi:hypothetical protein
LFACHDHGAPTPAPVAPAPPAPSATPATPPSRTPAWDGYFTGWVWIENARYLGEALLTTDGAVRLLVFGPYVRLGVGLTPSGDTSARQFVGTFVVAGETASGSGVVLGHPCASPHAHETCGVATPGALAITQGTREQLLGELVVAANSGVEAWLFELSFAEGVLYAQEANLESIEGSYEEQFAEFAAHTDVITSIDGNGRLFFQSPATGCVGNGSLTPHSDGKLSVYDVSLTIENCSSGFAHLAGEFEGLAAETTSHSGWECTFWFPDCDGLAFWLSSRPGTPQPRAMSMWIVPPK